MKPTGNEDDMRMPAADFDRIMGKVMGPKGQEQKESGFRDRSEMEPPPYLGGNPTQSDRVKYDPDKKPAKQPPQPKKK